MMMRKRAIESSLCNVRSHQKNTIMGNMLALAGEFSSLHMLEIEINTITKMELERSWAQAERGENI